MKHDKIIQRNIDREKQVFDMVELVNKKLTSKINVEVQQLSNPRRMLLVSDKATIFLYPDSMKANVSKSVIRADNRWVNNISNVHAFIHYNFILS